MWASLAAGLLGLPFLSLPGRYVFDTRDLLWLHPTAYLDHVLNLWRASPYLGHEQHDGIAVPMGVVVWLLRSAGLSPWVTQRLWHGLLLLVAAAGMILLVRQLEDRRTTIGPLVAGLLYSLTPYAFGYGLQFSAVFLPYVLMPFLLLTCLRGLADRRLLWPALFGLITFLMGGGNGAPQVYVLLAAAAFVLWATLVERSARIGSTIRFGAWSLTFFLGLNAYWLFLLGSPEVSNALVFSEQPRVINVSSSFSESIRGLGFWQYYGGDAFSTWIPSVRAYVTSLPLVLAGFAVPIGALVSAWLARWRYRMFFLFAGIASVVVAAGIFPVNAPSPFGRAILWLFAHVPGTAGLRTTYKVVAITELAFAVMCGLGAAALWPRLRSLPNRWGSRLLVAFITLVVAANSFALWSGRLYNPLHGVGSIPGYWQQALAYLDTRDTSYRAFFAPDMGWSIYRWGAIKEGVAASDPTLSSVIPLRLPVGERYGSNLMNAMENPYFYSLSPQGSADLFRYLGVRDIVLQNDADWQHGHTVRPLTLQTLLRDGDIVQLATFGRKGENVVAPGTPNDPITRLERNLHPVEVLTVTDPSAIVRADSGPPVVISGDGFGIASAARAGLLKGQPPVLYSGNLSSQGIMRLLSSDRPSFVITDSNRRRVWSFTSPRSPYSYTVPAGQILGGQTPGYGLFSDRTETQSVALYPGLRSITASGYGSVFGASPQFRPANAFDGDPSSWWEVGTGGDPTGAWVQANFKNPVTLAQVSISLPESLGLRDVRRIRLQFSKGPDVVALVRGVHHATVTFRRRATTFLRIRLAEVGPGSPRLQRGAAIADVTIPGFHPAEVVQVPHDLLDAASMVPGGLERLAQAPMTYLFERARTGVIGQPDEELRIRRRFETPGPAPYRVSGSGVLNRDASDRALDDVVYGEIPVHVTGSSRLLGNPALRGSAALDNVDSTSWIPAGTVGQSLSVSFPPHRIDHLRIQTDVGPSRRRIEDLGVHLSDGSVLDAPVPTSGVVTLRFPPREVHSVNIVIKSVAPAEGGMTKPVGIAGVRIPGVDLPHTTQGTELPCSGPTESSLDGRAAQLRPAGTVGQFLAGRTLPLQTCDGQPFTLAGGWHTLVVGGGLVPDRVVLSTGIVLTPTSSPTPKVLFTGRSDGGYSVKVQGGTGPFYLVIGQNYSPQWKATLGGQDLGPPLLLDGFSAGWRVARTGDYTITVAYRRQRLYQVFLLVTAATLVAAMAVITAALVRRRREQGA